MKTSFKMVAMLLGIGIFPVCAHAQKKVVIEDVEPNSIMFVSRDKAGDVHLKLILGKIATTTLWNQCRIEIYIVYNATEVIFCRSTYIASDTQGEFPFLVSQQEAGGIRIMETHLRTVVHNPDDFITTSTLFLKLVGRTKHLGDFVVYTAGNFRGDGKTFELQNAYAQFLGFTIGYSYGSFMDLSALPATIDFAGPNGSAFYRTIPVILCRSCKIRHSLSADRYITICGTIY